MTVRIVPIVLLSFISMSLLGQNIQVISTRQLTTEQQEPAFFPSYSAYGESIYFTRTGFSGLWSVDISKMQTKEITPSPGAGYEPKALDDGSLVYRQDEYIRGRKYTALYRYTDGTAYPLTEMDRFISPASVLGDRLVYLAGPAVQVFNLLSETFATSASSDRAILNDRLSLKLVTAGSTIDYQPLGAGTYIWAELSPIQDLIVFTKVGEGTFIADFQGKIITKLDLANAPRWSPDGQLITFMRDLDNGSQFTDSELWITNADASQFWQITDTPERIEMYPRWSPLGDRITYHSADGKLFETVLELSK